MAASTGTASNVCNFGSSPISFDKAVAQIDGDTTGAIMPPAYLHSLTGGVLIGLAGALYLLLAGRIAGVSGIVGGALKPVSENQLRNAAFLLGLFLGPIVYHLGFGAWPIVHYESSLWILALAGLFVGYGTGLGSGCTSGHGVCGLARLSRRSIVAVATFLATGMITVATMNRLGG
jgi:uncharacterized protein